MKKIFSAKTIVHAISKRFFAFMAASLLLGDKFFVTYAQSAGTSAINSAATELSAYAPSVKKLLYVIAGIIVLPPPLITARRRTPRRAAPTLPSSPATRATAATKRIAGRN